MLRQDGAVAARPCAAVEGGPLALLRVEGALLFAAGIWAFTATDEPWWLVPLLLFVPDVFMAGYAQSARTGAVVYNLAHAFPLPALVGAAALVTDSSLGQAVALIWFAHIGMDRAFGYGLKYASDFHDTHLGRIGRTRD